MLGVEEVGQNEHRHWSSLSEASRSSLKSSSVYSMTVTLSFTVSSMKSTRHISASSAALPIERSPLVIVGRQFPQSVQVAYAQQSPSTLGDCFTPLAMTDVTLSS